MTLNSIDQAVNVVLTGLIYGSGAWLACAFSFYVVTQQRKKKAMRPVFLLAPASEMTVVTSFEESDPLTKELLFVKHQAPSIEIIIEQPLPVAPNVGVERPVFTPAKQPAEEIDTSTDQVLHNPIEIVCEPVDWKQWKVADLRKASIARVCGVRTRPIGSRRNLPKADLIAQYKQQLKRMTKAPQKRSVVTEVVA